MHEWVRIHLYLSYMAILDTLLRRPEAVPALLPCYLSHSSNLQGRIRLHCSGKVDESVLREKIALKLGFGILKKLKTGTNTTIKTIHSTDPRGSEEEISALIREGRWRVIRTGEDIDRADLQRYLNSKLNPSFRDTVERPWKIEQEQRYQDLMNRLMDSRLMKCSEYESLPELSGVYVFLHHREF